MKYYSQSKQDKFIDQIIFKHKLDGVFVDIGANDGVTLSNTYYFEKELNWSGLCVEPAPDPFERLKQNRKSVLVNACASTNSGDETFIAVRGYGEMLSGLKSKYDPRHYQRLLNDLREQGGTMEEIQMICIDINDLLENNGLFQIDYLSVDTEGGEFELLKAINFNRISVSVITVENNFRDTGLTKYMALHGFHKIRVLEADDIYVNKKKFSFLERIYFKYKIFS